MAGHRADVDDASALAGGDQRRQQRVGDVDQAGDVGVDHGVPVGEIDLLRRLRRQRQAGVVDQAIDLAELAGQLLDHLLHRAGMAHVAGGDVHRHLRRQLALQRFQALAAPPGEDQRPAGLGEAAGSGAAEAGGGAGDEYDLLFHALPLF